MLWFICFLGPRHALRCSPQRRKKEMWFIRKSFWLFRGERRLRGGAACTGDLPIDNNADLYVHYNTHLPIHHHNTGIPIHRKLIITRKANAFLRGLQETTLVYTAMFGVSVVCLWYLLRCTDSLTSSCVPCLLLLRQSSVFHIVNLMQWRKMQSSSL